MDSNRIRLSGDFTLHRFAPENARKIGDSVEINDIFSGWKNRGVTVDQIRENVPYYVGYLCSEKMQERMWRWITETYGIRHNDQYCVTREGEWIGTLTHRQFRRKLDERRLWHLGIELFDAYCDQGLWTALIAQWIAHVRKISGLPGISACCEENNARSRAVLTKLWDRAAKYDYVDERSWESRQAFFLKG